MVLGGGGFKKKRTGVTEEDLMPIQHTWVKLTVCLKERSSVVVRELMNRLEPEMLTAPRHRYSDNKRASEGLQTVGGAVSREAGSLHLGDNSKRYSSSKGKDGPLALRNHPS